MRVVRCVALPLPSARVQSPGVIFTSSLAQAKLSGLADRFGSTRRGAVGRCGRRFGECHRAKCELNKLVIVSTRERTVVLA